MENERLQLLVAQEEIEKQRALEEERIKTEQKERQKQQIMAEQALVELEERRKQTKDYYEKVRKNTPDVKSDPQVEKEIDKIKNEMIGPDGQMEETKLPMAMQMSRYPLMESIEQNYRKSTLMRWEHQNYEAKKWTLDAKMEIAQVVLTERLAMAETKDQA